MNYEDANESEETLLQHGDGSKWDKPKAQRRRWHYLSILLNFALLAVSIVLAVERKYSCPSSDFSWLRQTSYYSPLWGSDLEKQLKKVDKQLDGSLFETPSPSPYRDALAPSAAVDAAWQQLEWIRTFPISASAVRRLGKDPELAVRFPPGRGLGAGAYVAQLDIFHQLHCLNLLRRIAWGEHARDGRTAARPYSDLHWVHVAHCAEVIRQNLVCGANLDVITFNWKETQDLPFADFGANKKCTNWEVLVAWQEANAVEAEAARNFTRPPGAKQVPISDEYFRIFGVEKVDLHPGEAHEHSYKEGE